MLKSTAAPGRFRRLLLYRRFHADLGLEFSEGISRFDLTFASSQGFVMGEGSRFADVSRQAVAHHLRGVTWQGQSEDSLEHGQPGTAWDMLRS